MFNYVNDVGDLTSSDPADVAKRVRAIDSLLTWKEDNSNINEMRQKFQENLRRVTTERDKLETKC